MCTCDLCRVSNYTGVVSFSMTPPVAWCGVDHPHAAHLWLSSSGRVSLYTQCPGSTGQAKAAVSRPTEGDEQ